MEFTQSTMPRTVILGVAASDAHVVANHLIAMRLRNAGLFVVNLGVTTPLSEFADALDRHPDTEAVIVGSVNGHAVTDLNDLPALRQAGRLRCPIILGGNLSVGSHKDDTALRCLYQLGVDHIVEDPEDLVGLLDELRHARSTVATGGQRWPN